MKYISLVLIALLSISCMKVSETKYSTASERVFLIITQNTTEAELDKIASEFKSKKNITVDYSKSEFNEDGIIKHLILEVDCNDGFKGVAETSEKILTSKNSGFLRDYSENSSTPFVIGAM